MDEPVTPLHQGALAMREMYLVYVAVGFTEDQALRIIAYTLGVSKSVPENPNT